MHLIAFDIDCTLVDSKAFDGDLYVKAIQKVLDIKIDVDWNSFEHVTDSGILDQIIAENNLRLSRIEIHSRVRRYFIQQTEDYISKYSGILTEIPGAKKLIETLKSKRDVALAIATGGWEETARMKLDAIGITSDDLPFASASDSHSRIGIMRIAEERALNGTVAGKKTYFGDGIWDKKVSEQLNYQFIAVGDSIEHHINVPDFQDFDNILALLGI